MKDSKIRRTFESSSDGDSKYQDYSSLPTNPQRGNEEAERFIFSVQRKDLSSAKREYVESAQTKPGAPFAGAQPKGMYSVSGSAVVDDYAKRTDWRERIQQAISESEARTRTPQKEQTPWPKAPHPKETVYRERVFEETEILKVKKDDILWEIDERITVTKKSKSISKEQKPEPKKEVQSCLTIESESKKAARAEAYTAWLTERSSKIKEEEEQLIQTAAAKQKKLKRAEAHDKWFAEREVRIAAEDTKLKTDVAANLKKQKYAEAHDKWLTEREARIAAEDAKLKTDVAANLKKQKYAEAHDKWLAEREVRIAAEDTKLKTDVAANLKKQRYAEAHDKWLAEREERVAAEDAQLKANAAANLKKRKNAEAYDLWYSEREKRVEVEERDLLERTKSKMAAASAAFAAASVSEDSALNEPLFVSENEFKDSKYEFKEIEDEFEAVYDEAAEEIFEQAFEDDDAVIEVFKEEIIAETSGISNENEV
ncbi:MAG: hypothetical protein LBE57_00190, partial [Methanosarcinales archaeon]|nr:hypothetical protein [Methanosarcinales archaeon]